MTLCKRIVWVLLLSMMSLGGIGTAFAQKSQEQLEKERTENQRRITEAAKTLEKTLSDRKATLGELSALQQQAEARQNIIDALSRELARLDSNLSDLARLSSSLERDLSNLKEEYGEMLYATSKTRSYDRLLFLFSSATFDQFLRRLKYLQQYAEMRSEQARQIVSVQKNLEDQQTKLNATRKEKEVLLTEQIAERAKLLALQSDQKRLVSRLNSRASDLRKELDDRKKADQRLEKLIADLIRREMRKTSKSSSSGSGRMALTPETAMISSSFAANKSRLIWPVQVGFISTGFGTHPHPVLKNVTIDNPGVDIQTNEGEKVRVVFDGEVGFVANIPGKKGRIVSVLHGEYITVYAGLREVNVTTGAKVKAKDVIGEVYTDKDGIAQLQFQIWKNNERLDPQAWLFRK
ncbi:Septal ring factor EnvC, activator of murein hydrolases AmiA and AmiB [Catalinimonas alkaloidigena]|uniref:Septal ring factor EnvC, activator of murein hydrolases AmiA and AmiB n=2 Tax=Catalinimonas alkaloidigena TaxID=1075417 RepID=A0A1G9DVQ2_9BACT|nr:Septal ring factor EnvC, activator of murein hydrolases AmiA and AmiB [Catalinimonas alkaloidigena]